MIDPESALEEIGDPAQIRGVALDIGGVLLSWAYGRYRVAKDDWAPGRMDAAWEERLGLEPGDFIRRVWDTPQHERATTGEIPFDQYWPMVGRDLGLSSRELFELWEDYWVISRLDWRVAVAVHGLRPRYKVAALSNAWSNAREEVSRRFGLDGLVDFMVISGEVGVAKPDRRIYDLLLSEMAEAPQHVLFIDDVEENVSAARDMGIRAVQTRSTTELLLVLSLLA